MKPQLILGIETSCDETAAAVYHQEHGMLSSELFSQADMHKHFGGVIPEVASREQLEKIEPIITDALEKASVTLDDIDVIAVTHKPGLPGSLLVGVCVAKSIAWAKQKKLIGVNHLEGHTFSASIEHDVPFPHLCLTASGGHTSLNLVHDFGVYETIGETVDDAAGEAFDKIAKLLGLPYPGGPVIEKLAQEIDFIDVCTYPRGKPKTLNFSFSGLKTAVLYDLVKKNAYNLETKTVTNDDMQLKREIASSLLVCIADIFEQKIAYAFSLYPHIRALTFVGGVACNKYIKQRLAAYAARNNRSFFTPSPKYCTDNAAMIAFVGAYKARKGEYSDFDLDILR